MWLPSPPSGPAFHPPRLVAFLGTATNSRVSTTVPEVGASVCYATGTDPHDGGESEWLMIMATVDLAVIRGAVIAMTITACHSHWHVWAVHRETPRFPQLLLHFTEEGRRESWRVRQACLHSHTGERGDRPFTPP